MAAANQKKVWRRRRDKRLAVTVLESQRLGTTSIPRIEICCYCRRITKNIVAVAAIL
jgi:hypothetical protein